MRSWLLAGFASFTLLSPPTHLQTPALIATFGYDGEVQGGRKSDSTQLSGAEGAGSRAGQCGERRAVLSASPARGSWKRGERKEPQLPISLTFTLPGSDVRVAEPFSATLSRLGLLGPSKDGAQR